MNALKVVLPWDFTLSRENFQTEDIDLEAPKESMNFQDWELSYYVHELSMKLYAYREEIRSRNDSLRLLEI